MKTLHYYFALLAAILVAALLGGCAKKEYTPQLNSAAQKTVLSLVDESYKDSTFVITPFGPRLRSDVHIIAEGHRLVHSGKNLQEVDASTGKLIRDFGVQTPLKYLKPNAGVVESRVGMQLNSTPNGGAPGGTLVNASPVNQGWKTWAQSTTTPGKGPLQNVDNVTFSTQWIVPSLPDNPNRNQLIFLFNGLQNASGTIIVQPVLQFGDSGYGGGPFWSVTSEYVDCQKCAFNTTTPVPVSVGNQLTGVIQIQNNLGTITRSYSSYFYVGAGSTTPVAAISGEPSDTFAGYFATLEDYGVTQSTDYPHENYVVMSNMNASSFTAVTNSSAVLGEHTVIINPTSYAQAYIYFHPAPLPVPVISYTTPDVFNVNIPITSLSPTNTGTTPTSYLISPALPAGLSFSASTGVISGTPTATSPATVYTVTATNAVGNGIFKITISVLPAASVAYSSYALGAGINNITFVGGPQNTTYSFTTGSTPLPWKVPAGTYRITITPVGQRYGQYDNGKGYTNVVFADGANGYCFAYTGGNFTFNWAVGAGDTLQFLVYNNNTCPFN